MRKVWLYKKADFNQINNEILEFQWEQFLHKSTDIEDMSKSRRAPFLVGSLITFVRLNSEIISNNLLLFSRNKSTFKSPFMIMFDV
jgi:hypothetical protein